MQCPHCGHYVSDNAKFCGKCGKKTLTEAEQRCSHCGKVTLKEQIYCPFCGYRISQKKNKNLTGD